jgi:hypothetical protein
MIMRQAQPSLRKPPRRDQGSIEPDPAKLSATLRELAVRAHELVRAVDGFASGAGPDSDGLEQELTEVYDQIVQLQQNLRALHLDGLATYVSALRERIKECLA